MVANRNYPAGTVLLETLMRYGEISYQPTDIVQREGEWKPLGEYEADLMERYRSSPEATVKFLSEGNGAIRSVVTVKKTPWWRKFLNCFLGFLGCMRRCFMRIIRCMRFSWAWLRDRLRC